METSAPASSMQTPYPPFPPWAWGENPLITLQLLSPPQTNAVFAAGTNKFLQGPVSRPLFPTKENNMKQVTIYTDGACSGNPGPGGWGAILMYGEHKKELSGGDEQTTNNRMELTAVIEALRCLNQPCAVDLWSDSKYVIDGLEKGWAKSWQRRGWVKSDKKPALNPDLWEELLHLTELHTLRYHWVKGHAENPYNNRCDEMAVSEWKKRK